jgi:hypothetical protein
MKLLKPILLLVLVFAAGLAVGIVGTRIAVRNFIRQAVINPEFLRHNAERDLTRKLGLNATQQIEVRQILGRTHAEMKGLWSEFLPRRSTVLSKTNADIAAILTPEQRNKFEILQAESRAFWSPR